MDTLFQLPQHPHHTQDATHSRCWPLIGRDWSRDPDTGLSLDETDHVTRTLASYWLHIRFRCPRVSFIQWGRLISALASWEIHQFWRHWHLRMGGGWGGRCGHDTGIIRAAMTNYQPIITELNRIMACLSLIVSQPLLHRLWEQKSSRFKMVNFNLEGEQNPDIF